MTSWNMNSLASLKVMVPLNGQSLIVLHSITISSLSAPSGAGVTNLVLSPRSEGLALSETLCVRWCCVCDEDWPTFPLPRAEPLEPLEQMDELRIDLSGYDDACANNPNLFAVWSPPPRPRDVTSDQDGMSLV